MSLPAIPRPWRFALLALIVLGLPGFAQLPELPTGEGGDRPVGDIITLTSGAQMTGVHVLRKTATSYHVQIVEGVVMEIPVSQVSGVEYDERRRSSSRRGVGLDGTDENNDEIRAQEMAPALNKVLTQPFEESFNLPEQDMLRTLEAVGEHFGITVELRPVLEGIPAAERQWTIYIPEGGTLLRLFRDDFSARFPHLVAVPQFDRVVVTTQADARESGLIEPVPESEEEAPVDASP